MQFFIANQTHHFGFINFLTFDYYLFFIYSLSHSQAVGLQFQTLASLPHSFDWKMENEKKRRINPRPTARKAVPSDASAEAPALAE